MRRPPVPHLRSSCCTTETAGPKAGQHTGEVDGLFSSTATARDKVRRRVLALTTVTGVAGIATVGGLMVGLVPAGAGQATAPAVVPPADPSAELPAGVAPAQQEPVATSGGS